MLVIELLFGGLFLHTTPPLQNAHQKDPDLFFFVCCIPVKFRNMPGTPTPHIHGKKHEQKKDNQQVSTNVLFIPPIQKYYLQNLMFQKNLNHIIAALHTACGINESAVLVVLHLPKGFSKIYSYIT